MTVILTGGYLAGMKDFSSLPCLPDTLTLAGVRIPFDPAIITPPIEAAIRSGRYEREEAAGLAEIVEAGDRVLEIGAGIGFISTLLDRLDAVEHVIAVEANPALMPFMAELHLLNAVSKVRRMNAVLAHEPVPKMTFYQRRDFWMGSLSSGPNPFEAAVTVPTARFDEFLEQEAITLIICDVEGAEACLFEDVALAQVTRIYLELHDHITGLAGIGRLFQAMARHGFAYDPRHSSQAIVLFRKVLPEETLRSYSG